MPAGPIGSSWEHGSWEDTAWELGSWEDSVGLTAIGPDLIVRCERDDVVVREEIPS